LRGWYVPVRVDRINDNLRDLSMRVRKMVGKKERRWKKFKEAPQEKESM